MKKDDKVIYEIQVFDVIDDNARMTMRGVINREFYAYTDLVMQAKSTLADMLQMVEERLSPLFSNKYYATLFEREYNMYLEIKWRLDVAVRLQLPLNDDLNITTLQKILHLDLPDNLWLVRDKGRFTVIRTISDALDNYHETSYPNIDYDIVPLTKMRILTDLVGTWIKTLD